jgi:hypothetical protein
VYVLLRALLRCTCPSERNKRKGKEGSLWKVKFRAAGICGRRLKQINKRWAFEKCPSTTGLKYRSGLSNFEQLARVLKPNIVAHCCLKMYKCQTQPQDMVNGV